MGGGASLLSNGSERDKTKSGTYSRQNAFPQWLSGKEYACKAGDTGSIPGSGRSPGEGNGNPLQVFFPGKPHGQRSYSGHGVAKIQT